MSKTSAPGSLVQRDPGFATKSFTRYEPAAPVSSSSSNNNNKNNSNKHRHRASTLDVPSRPRLTTEEESQDVFNKIATSEDELLSPELNKASPLPENFDELPIELASLTDRFVESLSAKSWEQPPSIEQISDLFQEFYITASNRISTHISTLLSRLNRETSPQSSKTVPRTKTMALPKSGDPGTPEKTIAGQQMLTATEVTEKRKARKLLEYKRVLLEEAVERRACEKVYSGIWRHKSTLDEVRDEKLRSKTAALALVGIGLKDLGIELDAGSARTAEEDVQELLTPAREGLIRMNEEKYPLGKLQHLTTAHKAIVDTLYSIHKSSSSADEVLPTLIYTLVTSPVEGINIISNLNFIQRFRASTKIDGESAYCMTNLEAAISFLENVDLASLRAEERPEGPLKEPSQPGTPVVELFEPFPSIPAAAPTTNTSSVVATSTLPASSSSTSLSTKLKAATANAKPLPSPRHQRTLSDLLQPVTAANEAVRNTAKEGIESISNTLDNSLKFLFGRLKEQAADPTSPTEVVVPKTLDEARRLVNKPVGPDAPEEVAATSETSSIADKDMVDSPIADRSKPEDRLLSLFGGKKPGSSIRDRSVDSQASNGSSSRKMPFTPFGTEPPKTNAATISSQSSNPLDSVKNIGGSLNPLSHFGNAFGGSFRNFGRPATPMSASIPPVRSAERSSSTAATTATTMTRPKSRDPTVVRENDQEAARILVDDPKVIAKRIREVDPPISKFVEAESMNDIKVGDIQELLDDYKRLARLLDELSKKR